MEGETDWTVGVEATLYEYLSVVVEGVVEVGEERVMTKFADPDAGVRLELKAAGAMLRVRSVLVEATMVGLNLGPTSEED